MSTPIDPTTANGRLSLYAIYEANAGKPPTRSQVAAIYYIARAVCPEHHVVVPVETLRFVIDADQWDDDTYFRAVETLRSLLPTEEATR